MEFTSKDKIHVKGMGTVFIVENPEECQDFKWLIGQTVTIDGEKYTVDQVGHHCITPPLPKGLLIDLAVSPLYQ